MNLLLSVYLNTSPKIVAAWRGFRPTQFFLAGAALLLTGCAAAVPIEPAPAQQLIRQAWQAHQHAVWDIDWPAAPVGGPVAAEIWQAGPRRRIEILEAPAPALIGQALVTDGHSTWLLNRLALNSQPPLTATQLAPVTPLIELVNRQLAQPAQTAASQAGQINDIPARQITLIFADETRLSLWLDNKTNLPLQLILTDGAQSAKIRARSVAPLPQPPPELFSPVLP
jgi:outer membrane lipoprotein-sorting protein